jgi:hypothetical protein
MEALVANLKEWFQDSKQHLDLFDGTKTATEDIPFGWLVRGMHKYGGDFAHHHDHGPDLPDVLRRRVQEAGRALLDDPVRVARPGHDLRHHRLRTHLEPTGVLGGQDGADRADVLRRDSSDRQVRHRSRDRVHLPRRTGARATDPHVLLRHPLRHLGRFLSSLPPDPKDMPLPEVRRLRNEVRRLVQELIRQL